jgi:transcriptional regulator with XRE-family HTH domain
MPTQEHLQEHELGNLLRYWRRQRGKSQLDLSLDTRISQRHLSFVESGRSTPSGDPRHLGAEIGFFSVLHSWNQRLQMNPHS